MRFTKKNASDIVRAYLRDVPNIERVEIVPTRRYRRRGFFVDVYSDFSLPEQVEKSVDATCLLLNLWPKFYIDMRMNGCDYRD